MADANHALDAASAQDNAQQAYVPRDSKADRARAKGGVMFSKGYDPRRNTKGRPPAGESYAEIMRELMELTVPELQAMLEGGAQPAKTVTALRQILDGLRDGEDLGVAARVRAYTYNRLDGMPTQQVETSSAADDALAAQLDALGDALREASEKEEAS